MEASLALATADNEYEAIVEKGGKQSIAKALSRATTRLMRPSSLPSTRRGSQLAAEIQELEIQEREQKLRGALPDYVQKLILGYELRTYYFEIIECFRKLAIVCLPVFFRPSGSVSQLVFGLMVCFLTFGAHMLYHPYIDHKNDRLAQLCQVQIFFSLLSSIALKYDPATVSDSSNMDALLSLLTFAPIVLSVYFEIPDEVKGFLTERLGLHKIKMKLVNILAEQPAHSSTTTADSLAVNVSSVEVSVTTDQRA